MMLLCMIHQVLLRRPKSFHVSGCPICPVMQARHLAQNAVSNDSFPTSMRNSASPISLV